MVKKKQNIVNYYGAFCDAIIKVKKLAKEKVVKIGADGVPIQNRDTLALTLDGVQFTWLDIQALVYTLDGSDVLDIAKELGISVSAVRIRKAKLAQKMGLDLKWQGNKFYKQCFRYLFDIYPLVA